MFVGEHKSGQRVQEVGALWQREPERTGRWKTMEDTDNDSTGSRVHDTPGRALGNLNGTGLGMEPLQCGGWEVFCLC